MEKKILFFVATILLSMASVFAQYDITVSADPSHGGFVGGGGNFAYGTQVTVSAIPDSLCYEFVCWIDDDGNVVCIDPFYTFTVTQSRNLVAHFVETGKTYDITVSSNPPGLLNSGSGTYSCGTMVTVCVAPPAGYQFINWTENGIEVSTDLCYTFTVHYPRDLVANFELVTYDVTVTAEPSECGWVTGGGENLPYGTEVIIEAIPSMCCDFLYWGEDGHAISTDQVFKFIVTRPLNLVAYFAVKTYDIITSANPSEGGTISGGGNVLCGDSTFLWANANPDYEFVNWTEDNIEVSANALYAFPVTYSRNLVANFEKVKATVAVIETIGTSAIKIYPNPTNGELKVVSGESKVEHVEIYDIFGKKVGVTRAIASETVIDISHLPAGVYFVKVITDAGEVVQKVVKE